MIAVLYTFKCIVWTLIAYGITQIIVESMMFDGFRIWIAKRSPRLGNMIRCMLCTGVWICFFLSVILWSPIKSIFINDIVDANKVFMMQLMIEKYSPNSIIQIIMLKAYTTIAWFKFVFFDGMAGGTLIWFMYVIERRLSYRGK